MSSDSPAPSPRPIPAPRPTSSSSPTGAEPSAPGPSSAPRPPRATTRASSTAEARAVKTYLDAFDACGRLTELRDAELESLGRRRKSLEKKLAGASSWQRLKIYSDLEDVEARLGEHRKAKKAVERLAQLEPGFIEHAAAYAEAASIPPQRFARLGIEARVLAEAGLA